MGALAMGLFIPLTVLCLVVCGYHLVPKPWRPKIKRWFHRNKYRIGFIASLAIITAVIFLGS